MFRRTSLVALGAAASAMLLLPGGATAKTKTVFAGDPPSTKSLAAKYLPKGFAATYQPSANAFFLHRVTIHAGDKVKFLNLGFHTIDLPGSSGRDLPLILPSGGLVSGVNDAAGTPFWFNGKVPNVGLDPMLFAKIGGSSYNGTARVESGLPLGSGAPKPFLVKFTKPGVYKYFCDVHPGMIGYVVVKAKKKKIPTAKQDAASLINELKAEFKAAKLAAATKLPADTVSLGLSRPGIELYGMFPSALAVKAGTTVRFTMSKDTYETHTATFGPADYLTSLAKGFQGAAFPAAGVFPSDPTQPVTESPTSHGNGFANTGALDQDPVTTTIPASGTVKFTKAGTYHYICLIHPFMQGTIIVK